MTEPVQFTEDRIPSNGIADSVDELVELFGGEMEASRADAREFTLPLRRGVATAGAVKCTLTWAPPTDEGETTVTLSCDRDIDAPKAQRVALLLAGVIGSLLFSIWPFFGHGNEFGTLAVVGGAVAIAVYLLTLKRTSGGLAFDFLQRLARRQRFAASGESDV